MNRPPIRRIVSPALVLPAENIDTDQIIPARFLTTTERAGLGEHAFADWRGRPDSPFDDPRASEAEILVAGRNFGCGSSREHAPWALLDLGIRVVISSAIADIFRANAIQNGLLPVVVDERTHAELLRWPWAPVGVDLERQHVELPEGGVAPFPFDAFARRCLLEGTDELGYLMARGEHIRAFEEARR